MFTSLYAAKRSGIIAFDWSDTCVIVTGYNHLTDETEFHGICLTSTSSRESYRSDVERILATDLGIIRRPSRNENI